MRNANAMNSNSNAIKSKEYVKLDWSGKTRHKQEYAVALVSPLRTDSNTLWYAKIHSYTIDIRTKKSDQTQTKWKLHNI